MPKKKKYQLLSLHIILYYYQNIRIPHNNLPYSGYEYTQALLHDSINVEPCSKLISMEEQLAIFLYIVGQSVSNRQAQVQFQHSDNSISKIFHHILSLLMNLAPKYIHPSLPGTTPNRIIEDTKYYPFFKNCLEALDGMHIPVKVAERNSGAYGNRKGFLSQNVLAVYDFNMQFTFIYAGWEGSAHDARVLADAWGEDFKIPSGYFYLADAGYRLSSGVLVPYRGTRYHLKEQALVSQRPQNPQELYNLCHASLRNVIEEVLRDSPS